MYVCIRVHSRRGAADDGLLLAEYTPVAYLGSDIDLFFGNYSPSQVGQRPALVSIDGGA